MEYIVRFVTDMGTRSEKIVDSKREANKIAKEVKEVWDGRVIAIERKAG